MILVYHKIDDRFEWGVTTVSPRRFFEQVDSVIACGFRFYTISDYLSLSELDKRSAVALMFDDAYENVHLHAFPLLRDRGIPATLGVVVDYVGHVNSWDARFGMVFRHSDWSHLAEMTTAGWEIASHSCSHRFLSNLPVDIQRGELLLSRQRLSQKLGTAVRHLVYPFGRATSQTADLANDCGYESASILGQWRLPLGESPFFVPRSAVYRFDGPRNILRKSRGSAYELVKEKTIAFGSVFTVLYHQYLN